jgi:hypothetical protein
MIELNGQAGGIADSSGNLMDGEYLDSYVDGNTNLYSNWNDAPSGDGIPGGDYRAVFAVNVTAPPTVAQFDFLYQATPQRIKVVFSRDVGGLPASSLSVTPAGGGPAISAASVIYDAGTRTATFFFQGILADGNYTARLDGAQIADASDIALDGNGDGAPGGDYVASFFQLAGDANRDRSVDFADLVIVAQNYGGTATVWGTGDFTGDGRTDFNDLVILAQRYGVTLPAAGVTAGATESSLFASERGARHMVKVWKSRTTSRPAPVSIPVFLTNRTTLKRRIQRVRVWDE